MDIRFANHAFKRLFHSHSKFKSCSLEAADQGLGAELLDMDIIYESASLSATMLTIEELRISIEKQKSMKVKSKILEFKYGEASDSRNIQWEDM